MVSRLTPMTSPRWLTRTLAALAAGVVLLVSACGSGEQTGVHGPRVQGTGVSTGAPLLTEGDAWDELGLAGTDAGVRYFAIEREPGTDVTVSVTAPTIPGEDDGVEVLLTDAAGGRCSSAPMATYQSSKDVVMSGTVSSSVWEGDPCLEATRLILSVTRTREATQPIQVRIRLFTVAGVENKDWPEHQAEYQLSPLSVGASTPGTPGQWLGDAGALTPGQTVSGEIGAGALHTYRIPLEWGQGLQVQLVFPEPSPSVQAQTKDAGMGAALHVVNPAGEWASSTPVYLSPGGSVNLDTEPVAYANRSAYIWAGYYTLVISVTSDKETSAVLPYQLIAAPYGATNNALGPQVVFAAPTSGPPEALLWTMLTIGVLLIIAGMAQVTLHRQRH